MQLHVYASHLAVSIGIIEYQLDVELNCASGYPPVGLYRPSTWDSGYRNKIQCCICNGSCLSSLLRMKHGPQVERQTIDCVGISTGYYTSYVWKFHVEITRFTRKIHVCTYNGI
jgi:hypothetical protein